MRRPRAFSAATILVALALGVVAALRVQLADASLAVRPVPPTAVVTMPMAAPNGPTVPATLDQPGSPAIVPSRPPGERTRAAALPGCARTSSCVW